MSLQQLHQTLGATLADDGIPLHYGNLKSEYRSALDAAILLDRSHEGRIILEGKDRFDLLNRMSTNKIDDLKQDEGCATLFTNANARILFRVEVFSRPDYLLIVTEPGQGEAFHSYLQKHIFFNDKVTNKNIRTETAQFALHGKNANAIMEHLQAGLSTAPTYFNTEIVSDAGTFTVARRKSITDGHWMIVCSIDSAVSVYNHILTIGSQYDLEVSGSLTYNTLRIRGGRPAGRELSQDYLPLEVGLWDEVHFNKGCYTGQEIIARMESRSKLAKTIVTLDLDQFVPAPAPIFSDNKLIGTLTSSVKAPTNEVFAIAVIKTDSSSVGTVLQIGDNHVVASVKAYAGVQPSYLDELI